MLYIHDLVHLTPKAADVESVPLIREIKQKVSYPLTAQMLLGHLSQFFVTEDDVSKIELALLMVEPTLEVVSKLAAENDPIHEPPSLVRAKNILDEMPPALDKNLQFAQELVSSQDKFIQEMVQVFNALPKLRNQEEKVHYNERLNNLFRFVLRNQQFTFNYVDVVNESQQSHIAGLVESLNKGFLFHYTLEEELKKVDFEAIKPRLPKERLDQAEQLKKKVIAIKNGVDAAYALNLRQIFLAVMMYSYVKWLNSGSL